MPDLELWERVWGECFDEAKTRSPEFDPSEYYKSGRASKANPNKEDHEWWAEHGPGFVDDWVAWRDACGLEFAEVWDDEGTLAAAIELECWAYTDDVRDLVVRCFIDRVMKDPASGDLYIIDLKTGSHTQPWPLQLILNNVALEYTHGVRARWGGFWSARKGGVPKWFDLSIYPREWAWKIVGDAQEIRDQQLFIPNPNNLCTSACGVSQYCVAMGGTPPATPFFPVDATLTHNSEEPK